MFGSSYNYSLLSKDIKWLSEIGSFNINLDFSYYLKPQHTLKFGFNKSIYQSNPGNLKVEQEITGLPEVSETNSSMTAFYLSSEQYLSGRFSFSDGIRIPIWTDNVPSTIYLFDSSYKVVDTLNFQDNESIKTFVNLDPRISVKYLIDSSS